MIENDIHSIARWFKWWMIGTFIMIAIIAGFHILQIAGA